MRAARAASAEDMTTISGAVATFAAMSSEAGRPRSTTARGIGFRRRASGSTRLAAGRRRRPTRGTYARLLPATRALATRIPLSIASRGTASIRASRSMVKASCTVWGSKSQMGGGSMTCSETPSNGATMTSTVSGMDRGRLSIRSRVSRGSSVSFEAQAVHAMRTRLPRRHPGVANERGGTRLLEWASVSCAR